MQSYDELIKIMLVGDSSVGKTSIIRAYCHPNNPPVKPLKPTVGLDYGERLVNIKGRNVLVQIWDTAGQERYQALTPSFYRSAMGILLVFSVTDKSSFNSVELWMRQIRQYAAEGVPVVILCNKIDISTKEVNDTQCKALEKRHKVRTLNTSVVSNHNIADAVFALY
jgi:Ras-related protein Rab-8A